jgi:hypothetical protein
MPKKFLLLLLITGLGGSAFFPKTILAQTAAHGTPLQLPEAPAPQNRDGGFTQAPNLGASSRTSASAEEPVVVSLEGARATLSLISEVSSKLPSGSAFQARLEQEVAVNGQTILPKGTLLEGHLQTFHARHLMRPGSLFMAFERAVLPDGAVQPVSLSLASADSNAVKSDAEGRLQPTVSKKRLLVQLGGAGLAAKFGDDLAQVALGTTLSAANARYFGMAAAGAFLVIQKGREVKLRPGDKLEVQFGRAGGATPVSR